jgi:hypothetical protein
LGFCKWYKTLKSDSKCSLSNTNLFVITNLLNKTRTNGIMEILKAYTLKGNPTIRIWKFKMCGLLQLQKDLEVHSIEKHE